MSNSEQVQQKLDEIAQYLSRGGIITKLTVPTPSGYDVTITYNKYREVAETGQNPIAQVINITSIANLSLSLSQGIEEVIGYLSDSNTNPKELSEMKDKLKILRSEIDKPNPDERVVKRIIRWASSKLDLKLFLKIAIPLASKYLGPDIDM